MSPTVFREAGYRFFFFSREEIRMHVHITSETGEAIERYRILSEVHYDGVISSPDAIRFSGGAIPNHNLYCSSINTQSLGLHR